MYWNSERKLIAACEIKLANYSLRSKVDKRKLW